MRRIVLLIAVAVLAPTGAVLWFMNEAARSQAESARQSVVEAYRGQARLLRERVDEMWTRRAAELERAANVPAMLAQADAVVLLDASGAIEYPVGWNMAADPLAERPQWVAAQMLEGRRQFAQAAEAYGRIADPRAAQAQVRCLLAAGERGAALTAIDRHFSSDRADRAIAASEQLLAAQLAHRGDRRYDAAVERLRRWVDDYAVPMPSARRLFLIGELRKLEPALPPFPYEAAERLAVEFVESGRPIAGGQAIEPAGLPGIWKLTAAGGRKIALYRTATIVKEVAKLFGPVEGARFAIGPVGGVWSRDSIPAGHTMPGWEIAFSLTGSGLDPAARRRNLMYLWVGYAVAAVLALGGVAAARFFGRQMKLARLKTDLVATVSHELRTPLASMRLLVDTLLEDEAPGPQKTREYLELISGENHRLTRLIENFLTFSRIERERQRFEFAPTAPARIVEAAMAAMKERLNAPGCAVEVDIGKELPRIAADEDALVTVLLNLLDNAYKYSPKEKRIVLRASGASDCVVFAVEDNGIGIPAREQKRIFRRFYQVDRRLARETGGCGLGLSIVDFIVKAHGGRVEVTSAAGAGSTFRVWLPACGSAAREAKA